MSEHVPGVRPVPKMDTPHGLFGGTCSCGWRSDGLETEAGALRSAKQHAVARDAVKAPAPRSDIGDTA